MKYYFYNTIDVINKPNMVADHDYEITRSIGDDTYTEIMSIRKDHFYNDIYDPRYWNGGIYELLSEEKIREAHEQDPTSLFLLVRDNKGGLAAYARFSVNFSVENGQALSKLHIFIGRKELNGARLRVSDKTRVSEVKAGEFMLNKILDECRLQRSAILLSEICIFPYPNLPSLALHRRYGFKSLLTEPKKDLSEKAIPYFIQLAKDLNENNL